MSARWSALPCHRAVFSNITGNRTMQEMLALANETAQRIAYDNRDWTMLKTTVTYVGDGVTASYNLPANYKRMLLTSNVWRSSSTQTPMPFVPDLDEWLNRRADRLEHGAWRVDDLRRPDPFLAGAGSRRNRLLRLPRQELHGIE